MIGAHGAGETPDTIPNSEAKPSSGDDTPSGESSTVPNYTKRVLTDSFCLLGLSSVGLVFYRLVTICCVWV